jgi:hypothetical protein
MSYGTSRASPPTSLLILTTLSPSSPGPPTPLGPDAQDGVATALRENVCAHLGHVYLCERGEWTSKPFQTVL